MHRFIRRAVTTAGATVGAMAALFTGTALAHECYIATKPTNGPQSANWFHITVADAAAEFAGFNACPAQRAAGEEALTEAGLPLSVKVFQRFTLAEKAPSKVTSNNKGLEHFGDGSTLADEALGTFIGAASATACP